MPQSKTNVTLVVKLNYCQINQNNVVAYLGKWNHLEEIYLTTGKAIYLQKSLQPEGA